MEGFDATTHRIAAESWASFVPGEPRSGCRVVDHADGNAQMREFSDCGRIEGNGRRIAARHITRTSASTVIPAARQSLMRATWRVHQLARDRKVVGDLLDRFRRVTAQSQVGEMSRERGDGSVSSTLLWRATDRRKGVGLVAARRRRSDAGASVSRVETRWRG